MARADNYQPATAEAVDGLVSAYNALVKRAKGETVIDGEIAEFLMKGLPQGSIRSVTYDAGTRLFGVTITETRKPRFMEAEAVLGLRLLGLFEGGSVYFNKNKGPTEDGQLYITVGIGITFQRICADAYPGETIERGLKDHHDVTSANFVLVGGSGHKGRREALKTAQAAYKKNAVEWGLSDLLPSEDYRKMLRNAFRLYDIANGHHLLELVAA